MTTTYTLVCTACHAGWEQDSPHGLCSLCGRPGQLRGTYRSIPLRGAS